MKPTLVVLAAGIGHRFGGLKQMVPVGPYGETILDYSLFDALRSGFEKLIFVVRSDIHDSFRRTVGQKYEPMTSVCYADQETEIHSTPPSRVSWVRDKPWGTAHAVLVAEEFVETPFAVINADDFYGYRSFLLMADFLNGLGANPKNKAALVGFPLRETLSEMGPVSRAICESDAAGVLSRIVEFKDVFEESDGIKTGVKSGSSVTYLDGNETTSMNFWGFTVAIFSFLRLEFEDFRVATSYTREKEFLLPKIVGSLILKKGLQVKVLRGGGPWFGMTYREDVPYVKRRILELTRRGHYPEVLWSTA